MLALTACSKYGRLSGNEKYTTVTLGAEAPRNSLIAAGPSMLGGVMIWGKNNSNGVMVGIYLPTDSAYQNVTIPYGDWTFGAIGWPGSPEMTGTPRCGVLSNVNVNSGTTAISVAISQAGCSDSKFTVSGIQPLRVIRCNTLINLVDGGSDCTGGDLGDIQSFKIVGVAYNPASAGAAQPTALFQSQCQPLSGSTYTTSLMIPDGESGGGSPMYLKVYGYVGSASCVGTPVEFNFYSGLRSGEANGNSAFYTGAGSFTGSNALFLKHGP